jgi:Family of unknown function (DUF5329)
MIARSAFGLSLALLFFVSASTFARDAREQKRIDFLLASLEKLPGAVFIRNGSEYKAGDAQNHLQKKLNYAGDRVKTAEDFIKYCATESSLSHQPYRIRFSDGRTVETAAFFREKLKEYDARSG